MRALILGCGSIGSRHARNLAALGVDLVLCDIVEARARALAVETGADIVSNRDAASTDVVVIATPTNDHPGALKWSLARGHHAFVEKPLAGTRTGLARAVAAAASSDRVVMVACNMRFSEGYCTLREQLPMAGGIVSISADFGWYLPAWRADSDYASTYSAQRDLGGGVLLDAAIHELDYILDLAGPVTSVSGLWSATGSLGIDVEDVAEMQLRHESGCISRIHVDYLRRTYTRECVVVGSDGTLVWNFPQGTVSAAGEHDKDPVTIRGLDGDRNGMYMRELQHFLDAVTSGQPTANDVTRAASTTATVLQVLEHTGAAKVVMTH